MDNLDTREWLLTNGLGSFASGTVCDARTRTYHGWLIAALEPPSQRTLLLSHLEASLEVAGRVWGLGTNFWQSNTISPLGYQQLRSFTIDPVPTWVWSWENWQLKRELVMPDGLGNRSWVMGNGGGCGDAGSEEDGDKELEVISSPPSIANHQLPITNSILIRYRYDGADAAILRLRPLIGDRNFHHQQSATPEWQFSQLVRQGQVCLQAIRPGWVGTPWQLRWSRGDYQPEGVWYWGYRYPEETLRGLGDREDLYSPGYITVTLQPGDTVIFEAKVGWPAPEAVLSAEDFEQALLAQQSPENQPTTDDDIWRQLLRAGEQFIAYRASISGPTIIAGYPWFNDWGRDTLIALPGLAIVPQRFSLAKGLLQTFGHYCDRGLIPNAFPDAGGEPFYNSIDASLWWIEVLGIYLEATGDWDFLVEQYPTVRQIYKAFCGGTLYNIRVDATDGLLTWDAAGVALTWMDVVVDGHPITPRCGKAVEINALWYSALCWATQWAERLSAQMPEKAEKLQAQRERYLMQAQQVQQSLQKFWNPTRQYFYDTISPDDQPDPSIRPNAVLALSLSHCGFDPDQARRVLQLARDRLLTPYGLRSLDPADPKYIGHYGGNPKQRDSAYHQGTVWSWLIGAFIASWKRFYQGEPVPFDWQPLLDHFQHQACLGSVSEIFDADPPHLPKGAFAQAWSVAELIRHWRN
ncbi:amylo-alpha-1,6-glucosidase [Microseira wollei]|uniref:Glycogen debranching enzyme n=1 Tax=Microseira wollei NIES-4236 TaxID=2530354 RepID=A0AAV3XLZ4_9CYAN|nr:amylo-alpha-1,6-glucosidase [Microseira wollei]GET43504.1 glycogen debranching enzyme [Microseira wollei NIES-4236]